MARSFTLTSILVSTAALLFAACSSNVVEPPSLPKQPTTSISDFPADTGNTGSFTLFRLRDSSIVANTDSASAKWDIGFNGTTIITNSGERGEGNGGSRILTGVEFDTLATAPVDGYTTGNVAKEWYIYTGSTGVPPHTILMKPGVVIVLKTADGKYAKLQILSYYKGAPASPTGTERSRMYAFRYYFQPDGSRTLKNAQ